MKKIIFGYIAMLFLSVGTTFAQNGMEEILTGIETNNTSLKALKEELNAAKLLNRTGLQLADPEVEFAYLWGSPGDIGNRKDFSVTQSFDLPTLTGQKKRVAEKENGLLDLQYKQERIAVLLQARKTLVELTYYNALRQELEQRYAYAKELAEAYQKKLKSGDANILEINKTELNLSAIRAELQQAELNCRSLTDDLQRLNGGLPLTYGEAVYPATGQAESFKEWYALAEAQNPVLQYVQAEVALGEENVRLNRSMGLPTFSAGYTSELISGQNYRGVAVGVSIPLWSNKNRVKQAKASLKAAESKMQDTRMQFYYSLESLYNKTKGLQESAAEYRNSLNRLNSSVLLKKALDAGQITLLEYLTEMSLYYDHVSGALAAERDYQLSLAELQSVTL